MSASVVSQYDCSECYQKIIWNIMFLFMAFFSSEVQEDDSNIW